MKTSTPNPRKPRRTKNSLSNQNLFHQNLLNLFKLVQKQTTAGRGQFAVTRVWLVFQSYLSALTLAKRRLFATSFLNSDFWSSPESEDILAINKSKKENFEFRRYFIIDEDMSTFAARLVETAYAAKERGDSYKWDRLERMCTNLEYLASKNGMWVVSNPIIESEIDVRKNELALYDEARVEIYKLDAGRLVSVEIYTNESEKFFLWLQRVEKIFDALHRQAQNRDSLGEFVREVRLRQEDAPHTFAIDARFLIRYKNILAKGIENCPKIEAEKFALLFEKIGSVHQHLDVGTCTGRYCGLVKSLSPNSHSVGLDRDVDCVDLVRQECQIKCWLFDIRDSPIIKDLGATSYDLVTCMMGTICHFGMNPAHRFGRLTGVESGFHNMLTLLNVGGTLVFTAWSLIALRNRRFLSIYSPSFCEHLAASAPLPFDLTRMIKSYGDALSFEESECGDLLRVYQVKKVRDVKKPSKSVIAQAENDSSKIDVHFFERVENFWERMSESCPPRAVFISYDRRDRDQVAHIGTALMDVGVNLWVDKRALDAGQNYRREIRRAVNDCAFFISVISHHSEEKMVADAQLLRDERLWAANRHDDSELFYLKVALEINPSEIRNEPEAVHSVEIERFDLRNLMNFARRVKLLCDHFNGAEGRPRK